MTEFRTKSGRVLTDEDIQKLADEAEAGYDPADFVPRTKPLTCGGRGSPVETCPCPFCRRTFGA